MSIKNTAVLTCPKCGQQFESICWDSLNGDLNPEEKEKLLNGKLFNITCVHCGNIARFLYPMLYHDMSKHAMVKLTFNQEEIPHICDYFKSASNLTNTDNNYAYKYRIVFEPNDLIEKAKIFDCELDDRIIEIMKIMRFDSIKKDYTFKKIDKIYFNVADNNKYVFDIIANNRYFASVDIDDNLYSSLDFRFYDIIESIPLDEYIIDCNWAINFIKRYNII